MNLINQEKEKEQTTEEQVELETNEQAKAAEKEAGELKTDSSELEAETAQEKEEAEPEQTEKTEPEEKAKPEKSEQAEQAEEADKPEQAQPEEQKEQTTEKQEKEPEPQPEPQAEEPAAEEEAEELKTDSSELEAETAQEKEKAEPEQTEKTEPEEKEQPEKPEQATEKQEKEPETQPEPQTEEPVAEEKLETPEKTTDNQEETATFTDDIPEPPGTTEPPEMKKEAETSEKEGEKKEKSAAKDSELAQYMETFKNYKQGDIIKGTIVGVSDSEVLVDISYKSEGSIPLSEFDGTEPPEKNSEIWVYYERSENADGKVLLSKRKADFHLAFDKMNEIFKNNDKISGIAKKRVRGGMVVEILGIEAFLPGSLVSSKPVPNLDHFINKEMTFKIINLDKEKKNVIVSRRKLMEEEEKEKIEKLREKIYIGAELDGEVKNITDYGAFVDLGGLDGLLHITDMTWGQIDHPSEMLNISDKVKVKVIDYKPEGERISLGLKQLVPHPWENIEAKYEEGTKVTVKVSSLKPYGAFVELEPGVEGLVHISEMSWTRRISNPKQVLDVGDTIDAIVLHASKEDKKISLGMKQMEPNPWLTIDERYPVGTVIKGKVRSLTPFGAFVEIEEDIDGLVHISDMSWTRRITNPKDFVSKGDEVEAVIVSIDKHLHRIALSMKQLEPDPWQNINEILPVNTEVTGIITNIISKGVLVQVEHEGLSVEGFVPISHLAIPRLERPDYAFSKGDELPMKVIELDLENRRLIFSVKAYLFSKEREDLQKFLSKYEPTPEKIAKKKEEARKRNAEKKKAKNAKRSLKKQKKERTKEEIEAQQMNEERPEKVKTDTETSQESVPEQQQDTDQVKPENTEDKPEPVSENTVDAEAHQQEAAEDDEKKTVDEQETDAKETAAEDTIEKEAENSDSEEEKPANKPEPKADNTEATETDTVGQEVVEDEEKEKKMNIAAKEAEKPAVEEETEKDTEVEESPEKTAIEEPSKEDA